MTMKRRLLKNITTDIPFTNIENKCCSKMLISEKEEIIDGGLRKKGLYKINSKDRILITIITIVLNDKKGIEKTIKSVLSQTYDNIEYIIIDGFSKDGTIEIIRQYEDYIDYYISEKDDGIYDAMNKGLSFSTGDYILMLNSGDYLYSKNVIKKVVENIKKEKADIVYGKVYYIDEVTKKKFVNWGVMRDYNLFEYHTSLAHQATFIHKKVYNLIGGYEKNYKICADAIFTYNAKIYNFNFKFIDLIISYYKVGGISSSSKIYLIEIFLFLYKKGIWDYERFNRTFYKKFNNKEEIDIIFEKYKDSLEELNLYSTFKENNKYKSNILIVNEYLANPFNKNLMNIFSLMGYNTYCSLLAFFLNIKYPVIIIEWEDYLLNDKFYTPNTPFDKKIKILTDYLNNYKNKNTKIIMILHNKIDHYYIFDNELYRKNINFKKYLYNQCDAIIHLGHNGMKECIDFYNLSNIKNYVVPHTLYYNYNIKYNKKDSKKKLKIDKDFIVIGFLGALRHQNEYDLIINSFNSLNIKKKKLLIVGNHTKKIKFNKTKKCIIISNFIENTEKYTLYLNATDIIFLPRIHSLNSGILFLGLSYSKIIVGPDVGNIGEYLKMFGYPTFTDEKSAIDALKKGVDLFINDPDIVYRNRIKAEELFSNYELAKIFKKIFNDLGIKSEYNENILNININNNLTNILLELLEKERITKELAKSDSLTFLLTKVLKKIVKKMIQLLKLPFKLAKKFIKIFKRLLLFF